jgi:hypothetical protein
MDAVLLVPYNTGPREVPCVLVTRTSDLFLHLRLVSLPGIESHG